MSQTVQPSDSIPVSPDFPVVWEKPGDEHLYWTRDRMHFPRPVTPLATTAEVSALTQGFAFAADTLDLPVVPRYTAFNGYLYSTGQPRSFDPAKMAEYGRKAEGTLKLAVRNLEQSWNEKFLPELQDDIATYRAFDYDRATDAELATHVSWALDRLVREWTTHFLIVVPGHIALQIFTESYEKVTQSSDEFAPFVLLQGLRNKTVDGGLALWRLSREAAALPPVRAALDNTDPEAVFAALDQTSEGRAFAKKFSDYLDEYGWRGEFLSLDEPSWTEDPRAPLSLLRVYLDQPDTSSPEAEQARLAAEREAAVAELRERLAGTSPEQREQFENLLHLAQFASVLNEDHNYFIDQMLTHLARRAFIEAGQRLVRRGQIRGKDDVMYLTAEELRAAISSADRRDFRALVEERRAQHLRMKAISPPSAVGTPPPTVEANGEISPFEKSLLRFSGGPPKEGVESTEIRGNAGSRGRVSGVARVAHTPQEAEGIEAGEILVCPTTAPSWTPLFAIAGAVVTDTGGILSHCAVVAREYGIPAVVGTHTATTRIRSGQRITVDGSAGVVTIDEG